MRTYARVPDWNINRIEYPNLVAYAAKYVDSESVALAGNQKVCVAVDGRVYTARDGQTGPDQICVDAPAAVEVAWARSGADGLKELIGDFAATLVDTEGGTVVLLRSFPGVRPLFWCVARGHILWASEIRYLRPLVEASLSEEWLAEFLISPLLPVFPGDERRTPWTSIWRVPSGHAVVVSREGTRWYDLEADHFEHGSHGDARSAMEYVEEFRDCLFKAVRARIADQARCASHLSGGLDSSSIACVAYDLIRSGQSGKCKQLFTISWLFSRNEPGDEWQHIEALGRHIDSSPHVVYYTDAWLMKDFLSVAHLYDEPSMEIAAHSQGEVTSRILRDLGLTVLLGGHGGDHLTAGSPLYVHNWLRTLDLWRFMSYTLDELRRSQNVRSAIMFAVTLAFRPELAFRTILGVTSRVPRWMRPALVSRWSLQEKLQEAWRGVGRGRDWSRRLDIQQLQLLRGSVVDNAPRVFGYETRYPFCDQVITRLALRVPPDLKWSHGISKRITRYAMAGIVPDMVLRNPRKFGSTRLVQWSLRREWPNIRNCMQGAKFVTEFVNTDQLLDALDRYRHGVWGDRLTMTALMPALLESWLRGNL